MAYALEESSRDYDLFIDKKSETGADEKVSIRGPMKKLQKKLILQSLCQLIGIAFDASLELAVADCSRQLEALLLDSLQLDAEEVSKKLVDSDQASFFVRLLEQLYDSLHSDEEMHEGMLVRSSSVASPDQLLTPLKCTPYIKQSLASHRLRKNSLAETALESPMKKAGFPLELNRTISWSNKLVDSIVPGPPTPDELIIPTISTPKTERPATDPLSKVLNFHNWLCAKLEEEQLFVGFERPVCQPKPPDLPSHDSDALAAAQTEQRAGLASDPHDAAEAAG